jgi:hypothetical protein
MQYDPESVRALLTPDQYYLYRLIWNRFVASQMPPAIFDDTTVDISAAAYLFRVKGSVPKFAGWLAVYERDIPEVRTEGAGPDAVTADDEDGSGVLPPLAEGDKLDLSALLSGFDPLTESINDFVFATTSGGNTTISVNMNGSGAGGATALAVLEGVNVTVTDLFNSGSIVH